MIDERRFRVLYGERNDGAGYVVVDSRGGEGADWRGLVVFKTDSKSDAMAKADELNDR